MVREVLITASGHKNRRYFTDRFYRYLGGQLEQQQINPFSGLLTEKDLTRPTAIPGHHTVDVMGTVLETTQGTFGVIRLHREIGEPEGTGRTTFWMQSVGLDIVGIKTPTIGVGRSRVEQLALHVVPPPSQIQLVASDMMHVGDHHGALAISPPVGEPLVALWDIVRHTYRRIDPQYQSGAQRGVCGRQRLHEILNQFSLVPIKKVLSTAGERYIPNRLAIISLATCEMDPPVRIKLLSEQQSWCYLRDALLNPLYHPSPFWSRVERIHKERVSALCRGLTHTPQTFLVEVALRNGRFPTKQVVEALTQLLHLGESWVEKEQVDSLRYS